MPLRWDHGRFGLLAVVALAALGCGGNGLPVVPVRGTVTFDGGPCPAAGGLTFTPLEVAEGLPKRPGIASFGEDGTFIVTSFREGDGLVPGRYQVNVSCDSGLPNPSSPDPWGDVSYVAKDWQPPELVVDKGSGGMTVTYDVKKKQPRQAR